jgi:excisionase family DNA binding protein
MPPTAEMLQSPYLTQEEAADYLRVTVAALQKWRRDDKGPPCYRPVPRGQVYFRKDELDAWVESGLMQTALGGDGTDGEAEKE